MSPAKKQRHRENSKHRKNEDAEPDAPASESQVNRLADSFLAILCLIVLTAWCVRTIHVFRTATVPTVQVLVGDAERYFQWGEEIAGGDWYGDETFYQAPLYPYFLALTFKLFGANPMAVRLMQAFLGAVAVGMLGTATRNFFGKRAGLIAAMAFALYPPAIYYDGLIQKAALASFLLCGLLLALSQLTHRFRMTTGVVVGIVLGMLVLTRENALLWIPVVLGWLFLAFRDFPQTERFRVIGGYSLGLVIVLFPVAARNASLGGEWSPTTFQSGPNFYIGNNLHANGIYQPLVPGHETPEYERADAQALAEQAAGRSLSSREVSKYWMGQATTDIASDPLRWVGLMLVKVAMVVNRYEVPDVESFYVHRQWFSGLHAMSKAWHFGILAPIALLGMLTLNNRWRCGSLLSVLILSMIFAVALFFVLGRYRFPLVPLLMPLAACGLLQFHRVKSMTRRRQLVTLFAVVVATVLCNIPVHSERELNASSYMNVGVAAGKAGDLPTCIRWLKMSVQQRPEDALPHYNLAGAYLMQGNTDEAIKLLRRAKQLDPLLVEADEMLQQIQQQAPPR